MNFFGHAVVAAWHRPRDGFVLGAMLPDFASMIGARPPGATHGEIRDGIAFHHETDRVFHEAPTFTMLERQARTDLAREPLRRGSKLAVAHIGVELILDGVLARDARGSDAFLSALRASAEGLDEHLEWRETSAPSHFSGLVGAIRGRLERGHDGSPQATAWRIERALSGRPRLALMPGQTDLVRRWVETTTPRVEARAQTLIAEICDGLGVRSPAAVPSP